MAEINDGILANEVGPRNVTDLVVVNNELVYFYFNNTTTEAALMHLPRDDHRGQSSVIESIVPNVCHPPGIA